MFTKWKLKCATKINENNKFTAFFLESEREVWFHRDICFAFELTHFCKTNPIWIWKNVAESRLLIIHMDIYKQAEVVCVALFILCSLHVS